MPMTGGLLGYINYHNFSVPTDWQGAAGAATTGDWGWVGGFDEFEIVLMAGAGTASQDVTVSVLQATTAAGAGSKALNVPTPWTRESVAADLSAVGVWIAGTGTVSTNTYTDLTNAESSFIWVFQFQASDLDADGGFDFVNCTVPDVGGNAKIGVVFMVGQCRFKGRPTALLSTIAAP